MKRFTAEIHEKMMKLRKMTPEEIGESLEDSGHRTSVGDEMWEYLSRGLPSSRPVEFVKD